MSAVRQSFSAQRKETIVTCMYCPERPYLELKIPSDIPRVDKVTIKVLSHDQGFCDNPNEGTWSWFIFRVVTPSGHARTASRRPLRNLSAHAVINRVADFTLQKHTRTWSLDDEDEYIRDLVQGIRVDDKIQIIPLAYFPAWRNYTYSATIKVSGTKFSSSTPIERVTMPGSSMAQQYAALDAGRREVRILRLKSGLQDAAIECQLESTFLLDRQHLRYDALSYNWSGTSDQRTVKLANPGGDTSIDLKVTLNLFEALIQLRKEDDDCLLWVDAICINQHDIHERGQQVSLMKEIYSKANAVIVWLGAFKSDGYLQDRIDRLNNTPASSFAPIDTQNDQQTDLGPGDAQFGDYCVPLGTMFSFNYFQRVWVLQEVYNARRLVVLCGTNVLRWTKILQYNRCASQEQDRGVASLVNMPQLFSGLFKLKIIDGDGSRVGFSRRRNLPGIMETFIGGLGLDASDPRDKLFALLGFGSETWNVAQLPKEIAPDYNKSVGQVFAEFTRWWIKKYRSLRILSAIHASVGRTWMKLGPEPEFPGTGRASWSIWYDGLPRWANASLAFTHYTPWYQASGGMEPDIELMSGKDLNIMTLPLRGRRLGGIRDVTTFPYYKRPAPNTSPAEILRAYRILFDPEVTFGYWALKHFNFERPPAAAEPNRSHAKAKDKGIQRDLDGHAAHVGDDSNIMGSSPADQPNSDSMESCRYGTSTMIGEEALDCDDPEHDAEAFQISGDANIAPFDHLRAHELFAFKNLGIECHQPCLLTTAEDHHGICPPGARAGDLVVILNGGRVPYIVREIDPSNMGNSMRTDEGSKFCFVGECYLEGFMEGEACEDIRDSVPRFPEEVFELV